jgi:hypothetical protein
MSDRPDFTANTALNAVADTLDNLPVSINAQALGSLAVDIAAQSAGDIDINLNTASDTVTVALGSSTVTLDVNIAGSTTTLDTEITGQVGNVQTTLDATNTTVNTNITGSFATVDTDIVAQSGGNIDTVIDGQVGDVDIRFASQTGNVDINFDDQTGGVESGTEFAAQQGNTITEVSSNTVASGNFVTDTVFDNTTGGVVVLETLTMACFRDYVENSNIRFFVEPDGTTTNRRTIAMNPVTAPLVFDPGIRLNSAGEIEAVFENNGSTSSNMEAIAVLRVI